MKQNEQKIINFMINEPRIDFLAKEVEKGAKISKAGANLALKNLVKENLIGLQKRGKVYFYSINFEDPELIELKKLQNIKKIKPLVAKIAQNTKTWKVVLFGSSARGENLKDSDFDLFILTAKPATARKIIDKSVLKNKLQTIIKTPVEFIKFSKDNPILAQEIDTGIILWQQQ